MSGAKQRGGRRAGAGRPPGAPNKMTADLKAYTAEKYGQESIDAIAWLAEHAESEQVRLAARIVLLDRAYGRPRQEFSVSDEQTIVIVDRGGAMSGPSRTAIQDQTAKVDCE